MHGGSHLISEKSGEDNELEHCVGVCHDYEVKERFFRALLKNGRMGWGAGCPALLQVTLSYKNVHTSNCVFSLCSCHSKTMFSKSLDISEANPKFNKEERYKHWQYVPLLYLTAETLKMQYLPFLCGDRAVLSFLFREKQREWDIYSSTLCVFLYSTIHLRLSSMQPGTVTMISPLKFHPTAISGSILPWVEVLPRVEDLFVQDFFGKDMNIKH